MNRIQRILAIVTIAFLLGPLSLAAEVRYFHDDLDRLVRVEYPDGIAVTYTYDPVGNRLSRETCFDVDFDTFCNAVDNCPDDANPNQTNGDGDAAGDVCDCAPADGTEFDTPHEISDVAFSSKSALEWSSDAARSGTGTQYRVMRGSLAELPVGSGASEVCIEAVSVDTASEDTADPGAGFGFYYLIRGFNGCGEGGYGFDSGGQERLSNACP